MISSYPVVILEWQKANICLNTDQTSVSLVQSRLVLQFYFIGIKSEHF
jgi:hypothetical protein